MRQTRHMASMHPASSPRVEGSDHWHHTPARPSAKAILSQFESLTLTATPPTLLRKDSGLKSDEGLKSDSGLKSDERLKSEPCVLLVVWDVSAAKARARIKIRKIKHDSVANNIAFAHVFEHAHFNGRVGVV